MAEKFFPIPFNRKTLLRLSESLSKCKMIYNDGLKNKRSANSLHLSWEFRADFSVNWAVKEHAGERQKSPQKAKITSKKQKVVKCVAFLTGGEERLNVNRIGKDTLILIYF